MDKLVFPTGLKRDKLTEASTLHRLQMDWRPQTLSVELFLSTLVHLAHVQTWIQLLLAPFWF